MRVTANVRLWLYALCSRLVAITAAFLAASLAATAATAQGSRWTLETTPYVWATGLSGTLGVRDRLVDVDISFRDIFKHLDGAFMLPLEARNGRFAMGAEIIYVKMSDQAATPGPLFTSAELAASQRIMELSPRFRILTSAPVSVDILAGARYWNLSNTLTLTEGQLPAIDVDLDESWIDPIVGGRLFIDLNHRIRLQLRGDVGGFDVGSKSTSQVLAGLSYRLSDRFTLRGGYRQLNVNFRNDDRGFVYDVGMGGPILGGTITF